MVYRLQSHFQTCWDICTPLGIQNSLISTTLSITCYVAKIGSRENNKLSIARSIPSHELFTIFLHLGKSYTELQKSYIKYVHLNFMFHFSIIFNRKDTDFFYSFKLKSVYAAIKKKWIKSRISYSPIKSEKSSQTSYTVKYSRSAYSTEKFCQGYMENGIYLCVVNICSLLPLSVHNHSWEKERGNWSQTREPGTEEMHFCISAAPGDGARASLQLSHEKNGSKRWVNNMLNTTAHKDLLLIVFELLFLS